jgi:glyoxylase-like metal-dependent hydrolase (beta-lactamase superfamily II)
MMRSTLPEYEVFAVRYATVQRTRNENFIVHDPHDGPMPMDYFVWLIRGADRQYLVDTGFNQAAATARKRQLLRCPIGALEALGVRADQVTDVLLTHLHYDHAGNMDLVPNARLHIQETELHYAVGRYMGYKPLRHAYAVPDIQHMVGRVHAEQVVFHDGDSRVAPGVELIRVGGHTQGLQAVRVHTARGWVVLASDASHYYDNLQTESPFPLVHDVGAMLDGYRKLSALAESPDHLVPGHDPLVMARYPRLGSGTHEIVCLHQDTVQQQDAMAQRDGSSQAGEPRATAAAVGVAANSNLPRGCPHCGA